MLFQPNSITSSTTWHSNQCQTRSAIFSKPKMNFYQLVGLKVMILKMCKLILFLHLHVPSYDAVLEGLGGQPWTFFWATLFGGFSSQLIGWTRIFQYITRRNSTHPLLATHRIQSGLQYHKLLCLRADISIFPHKFFSMLSKIILYPVEARYLYQ